MGVGDGVIGGVGLGVAPVRVGDGVGDGEGETEGLGDGLTDGEGLGVGLGDGFGVGLGVGLGEGDATGVGVGRAVEAGVGVGPKSTLELPRDPNQNANPPKAANTIAPIITSMAPLFLPWDSEGMTWPEDWAGVVFCSSIATDNKSAVSLCQVVGDLLAKSDHLQAWVDPDHRDLKWSHRASCQDRRRRHASGQTGLSIARPCLLYLCLG